MKNCTNCEVELGRRNTTGFCRACRVKKWVAEHRERSNEIKKKYVKEHATERYETLKKYKENNRKRVNAWAVLQYHVNNGDLDKPNTCSICDAKRPLHAHHPDINRPLYVKWVCASCHKIEHGFEIGVKYA